ncbi:MAG: hypothetical protein IPM71_01225 [Bacteroidota bacterium]|nr:MAG: hypothetical protein IPM71_01225 [Bacteroidota bacterium]
MNNVRKITGIVLVALILIFTSVAILGIWEIIDLQEVLSKVLSSMLIVFVAAAVILFITTVLIKEDLKTKEQ